LLQLKSLVYLLGEKNETLNLSRVSHESQDK